MSFFSPSGRGESTKAFRPFKHRDRQTETENMIVVLSKGRGSDRWVPSYQQMVGRCSAGIPDKRHPTWTWHQGSVQHSRHMWCKSPHLQATASGPKQLFNFKSPDYDIGTKRDEQSAIFPKKKRERKAGAAC